MAVSAEFLSDWHASLVASPQYPMTLSEFAKLHNTTVSGDIAYEDYVPYFEHVRTGPFTVEAPWDFIGRYADVTPLKSVTVVRGDPVPAVPVGPRTILEKHFPPAEAQVKLAAEAEVKHAALEPAAPTMGTIATNDLAKDEKLMRQFESKGYREPTHWSSTDRVMHDTLVGNFTQAAAHLPPSSEDLEDLENSEDLEDQASEDLEELEDVEELEQEEAEEMDEEDIEDAEQALMTASGRIKDWRDNDFEFPTHWTASEHVELHQQLTDVLPSNFLVSEGAATDRVKGFFSKAAAAGKSAVQKGAGAVKKGWHNANTEHYAKKAEKQQIETAKKQAVLDKATRELNKAQKKQDKYAAKSKKLEAQVPSREGEVDADYSDDWEDEDDEVGDILMTATGSVADWRANDFEFPAHWTPAEHVVLHQQLTEILPPTFMNSEGETTDRVKNFFSKAATKGKAAVLKLAGKGQDAASKAAKATKDAASKAAAKASDITSKAVDKGKEVASKAASKASDIASSAADKSKEVAGAAVTKTKSLASKAAGAVQKGWHNANTDRYAAKAEKQQVETAKKQAALDKATRELNKAKATQDKYAAKSKKIEGQVPARDAGMVEQFKTASTHIFGQARVPDWYTALQRPVYVTGAAIAAEVNSSRAGAWRLVDSVYKNNRVLGHPKQRLHMLKTLPDVTEWDLRGILSALERLSVKERRERSMETDPDAVSVGMLIAEVKEAIGARSAIHPVNDLQTAVAQMLIFGPESLTPGQAGVVRRWYAAYTPAATTNGAQTFLSNYEDLKRGDIGGTPQSLTTEDLKALIALLP